MGMDTRNPLLSVTGNNRPWNKLSIEVYGYHYEDGTDNELSGQSYVEQIDRYDARDDDSSGRCKTFENVVGVLHHDGDKNAAQ